MNDVQKGYKKDDLDHESQVVEYDKRNKVRLQVEPKPKIKKEVDNGSKS